MFSSTLPDDTLVESLDSAAVDRLCGEIASFQGEHDRASGIQTRCFLRAAELGTTACNASVTECLTRGVLQYTCNSSAPLFDCAGVTIQELEAGIALYVDFEIDRTQAEWCSLAPDARYSLGNLIMPEPRAYAGFNCFTDTALQPVAALAP